MKKKLGCLYVFLLTISMGWLHAASTESNLKKIHCRLEAIPSRNTHSSHLGVLPHIRIRESTSLNWSGYAAATSLTKPETGSVSAVAGSWVVPTLSSQPGQTYSSFWVGIDGYASSTVEQIGTEHDWSNDEQSDYAWFEMYPGYSFKISGFPVNPGDEISASVKYVSNNKFQLAISNLTHGVTTVVPGTYTKLAGTHRSSAEWVVEAPFSGSILPLADFGTASFTNCTTTILGVTGPINSGHWVSDELTMETQNGIVKALPSVLSGSGEDFHVTWEHE